METCIVVGIVGITLFYAMRFLYKTVNGESHACSCGTQRCHIPSESCCRKQAGDSGHNR